MARPRPSLLDTRSQTLEAAFIANPQAFQGPAPNTRDPGPKRSNAVPVANQPASLTAAKMPSSASSIEPDSPDLGL
jgi:hypothetical protein